MIAVALRLEADGYVEKLQHLRDKWQHAHVVRNGYARELTVSQGVGQIKAESPRVDDPRAEHRCTRRILPPRMRRSPRLEEVSSTPCLRGLSTGDFPEALPVLLGPDTAGLPAPTINRLLRVWKTECQEWRKRSPESKDCVRIWVDGIYFPGSDLRQGTAGGGSPGVSGNHQCTA